MPQFTLPVNEYASDSGELLTPSLSPFVFNDRQLIIGMVRSILTANARRSCRRYMAAIVKPTLQFMLNWSKTPQLCVSSDFLVAVRDFSVTGRIGELAQGVSYAYWKWVGGYTLIADFGDWTAKYAPIPKGINKKPDYVMMNPLNGDIVVMEAKGTLSTNHRAQMGKALSQCKAVRGHVFAKKGYGSVLTLGAKVAGTGAALHLRDPGKQAETIEKDQYGVFRRSYLSWFELAGDAKSAALCRRPSQKLKSDRMMMENQWASTAKDPLATIVAAALGFRPERTSFETAPEIMEALHNIDAYRSINWSRLAESASKVQIAQNESVVFPDGTRIVEQ